MSEQNKPTVSLQAYIRSGAVQERLESMLEKRAGEFTVSLMSVVNSNPVLQECPPETVVKAALVAAGMNLPINPNLGFAFIIPYNNKIKTKEIVKKADGTTFEKWNERWEMQAQFQMGYKGFIQLAQRSGQFKRINATDVRDGEYKGLDRRSGELNIEWVDNEADRDKLKVVGYLAYFKLMNGFEKELYMTVDDLLGHAKKYSKNYAKYGTGLWKDQFEVMSKKTVLKLLISTYGALSTSIQEAILADQAAVQEDGYKYIDNDKDIVSKGSDNTDGSNTSSDEKDPIEGEVVDPPANDDIDQTPPEDKVTDPETADKVAEKIIDEAKENGATVEPPKEKSTEKISGLRRARLFALLKDRGFTGEAAKQVIYSTVGVESVNDILVADYDEIITMLKEADDADLKAASETETK